MADFSENIVNKRFRETFYVLEKNNLIKGKSDLAKHLGTYNHVINSILKGKRNITVEQLHKLFEKYRINANYMFGFQEEMFLGGEMPKMGGIPSRSLDERNSIGRQNITFVPQKAIAGYALQRDNDFLKSLPRFSVPGIEGSGLIAIEIEGDSMMPTLTNSDIVICEPIERNTPIYDNQVYVILSDVVVVKRIQQIKENGQTVSLRLISDNSDVFKPYSLDTHEVQQILKVKCRLTRHAIN